MNSNRVIRELKLYEKNSGGQRNGKCLAPKRPYGDTAGGGLRTRGLVQSAGSGVQPGGLRQAPRQEGLQKSSVISACALGSR